jgi:hypothetical protein
MNNTATHIGISSRHTGNILRIILRNSIRVPIPLVWIAMAISRKRIIPTAYHAPSIIIIMMIVEVFIFILDNHLLEYLMRIILTGLRLMCLFRN